MATESKTVVVPGVKAGVSASVRVFPPYDLQGLTATGYVSADDEVTIVLDNNTAGAINLDEGLWSVVVENYPLT